MKKAILYKERTAQGKQLRQAYDRHQVGFSGTMKHRVPRLDGISNTLTSFFTDNLVLIIRKL